ncbi:gliding motility-associated C-terminal domain-containing protein [Sediminibacterium soli]|uniref:gliding motility-associated C-terminal domain-containing protein n=1 Tax=Sediminibacterium soli TaxID=2698829 RepID=UPI00137A4810|nr:gliding motility-associated C-terminal domain-containing protein [Sediminibacterium soli]NCI47385.1 gliding motility-associated C-terminal domain-containing protein [Sediminibacterium soli]
MVKTIFTARKELFCAGNLGYTKNNLVRSDGWLSLFTESGNLVWSKRMQVPGYDLLTFRDMTAATDSTFLISGFIQTYWGATDPLNPVPNPNWGVLLHVDRYGNLLWARKMDKSFQPGTESTFIENLLKTRDGDIVMNTVLWKRPPFQTKTVMLKMDLSARIKWATAYASDIFEFRFNLSNRLIQLANGAIVAAGIIDQRIVGRDSILKVNYYWLSLDEKNGTKRWDRCYLLRNKAANVFFPESSVRNITELPNGDISFAAYADTNAITVPPASSRSVNMIADANGMLKKTIAYQTALPGSYTVDGSGLADGSQLLLTENGGSASIAEIDVGGRPVRWNTLQTTNGRERAAAFCTGGNQYFVFMNIPADAKQTQLVRTAPAADVNCRIIPGDFTAYTADFFSGDNAQMQFGSDSVMQDPFSVLQVTASEYPLQRTDECNYSCCASAAAATMKKDTICSGGFVLPDNTRIQYSGDYFVRFSTAKGCDSIVYYSFEVRREPSSLSLGKDTCMENKDSVVLYATPGYGQYRWMNEPVSTADHYTVRQAGVYSVSVQNICGAKTSRVTVHALCDAPLYIPNAFTPNGDYLNDVFRIPATGKHKLISFRIYNRWGNLLFSSDDFSRGWDGSYRKIKQPSGTYVYQVEAESLLTGRKISLAGSLQLIR